MPLNYEHYMIFYEAISVIMQAHNTTQVYILRILLLGNLFLFDSFYRVRETNFNREEY